MSLCITVAFADRAGHTHREYDISPGTTIDTFIQSHVGLLPAWAQDAPCGVWGVKHPRSHILQAGDRLEFYRPLVLEPKDARRLRAKKMRLGISQKSAPNRIITRA